MVLHWSANGFALVCFSSTAAHKKNPWHTAGGLGLQRLLLLVGEKLGDEAPARLAAVVAAFLSDPANGVGVCA